MTQQVHGHKLLEVLSEQSLTKDDLKAYITERFGSDVQFHTCKSDGLDFDALFEFLIRMQKIIAVEGKYTSNVANHCAH